MRTVLFRGKAVNRDKGEFRSKYRNGDWVYGVVSRIWDENFPALPAEMTNTAGISGIDVDHTTIGESTGISDKAGKLIFEGDILRLGYLHGYVVVKWRSDIGGFALWIPDCEAYNESWTVGFNEDTLSNFAEVVGNIHDNPELISKE